MGRLAHIFQHLIGNMLRSYTKLSAYMIFGKFIKKSLVRVCQHIIETHTGTDKYFFYFWKIPELTKKRNVIFVIRGQILTWLRKQTMTVLANASGQLFLAGRLAKVRCRSAYIVDISLEIFLLGHVDRFFQN